MQKRHLRYAAALMAVLAVELAPVTAAHAHSRYVVHQGESIQEAVDAARPGDTIEIRPGTFRESVQITTSGLTLRGAGTRTVIMPEKKPSKPAKASTTATAAKPSKPAKASTTATAAKPSKPAKASTTATAANPSKPAKDACAKAGHGICVTGTAERPVTNVKIRSLAVTGFRKNGIWGTRTDRMDVRHVLAQKNGEQGLGQQLSTRGVFRDNLSRNNAESGIFLANTVDEEGGAIDTKGALIHSNRLTGNRIGLVIRRARALAVEHNVITGNCGGVFVVGDESTPRAGSLTIAHNQVYSNNKYCPATARLPFIQGAGIVLTGAEDTVVAANQVRNNVGNSPMSGGIVLFRSVVGVPNSDNTVSGNELSGNKPADLVNRDTTGKGNVFLDNVCQTSQHAGRCVKAVR